MKRVMFTLPAALLARLDQAVDELDTNRSQVIRDALEHFLEQKRRNAVRELLKEGYLVHADRDRRISEEFAHADYDTTRRYAPYDEDEE